MSIVWEDPPRDAVRPGRREGGKFGEQADALRANPGKSMRLVESVTPASAKALAGQIERGKRKGFEPAGAFSTAVSGNIVWVTYDGPAVDPDDESVDPDED